MWRANVITLVLALAACGDSGGMPDDMMQGLPDGFVQFGCTASADCDDNDPCTLDTCSAVTGTCDNKQKNCAQVNDDCNRGMCSPLNGSCTPQPINEGQSCSTATGGAGSCISGVCAPLPSCSAVNSISCDSTPISSTTVGFLDNISTYACATGLNGGEYAINFYASKAGRVTLALSGTTADLDLLVLDGTSCNSASACLASATTASGNETVTFDARSGTEYTIVIDGKGGASSAFDLSIDCAKACIPETQTLGCGSVIHGDTSLSTHTLQNVNDCTPTGVTSSGPEQSYTINVATTTDFRLNLKDLTQDLDLGVIYAFSANDCSGFCEGKGYTAGTADETASFTAYNGTTYYVVVDSKTTGGPYTLEVLCPPSCAKKTRTLSCSSPGFIGRNDDASYATQLIDSWGSGVGGAANTTGPEVVWYFHPPTSGQYTFTLTGLSADLDLILVETSSFSVCDPTLQPMQVSTNAGLADESITATLDVNKYYYLAVDGKPGAVSSFNLRLSSTSCPPPNCGNSANRLSCNYLMETRRNDDLTHSKAFVDSWGGCLVNTTGPEVVYSFTPTVSGTYTVALGGIAAGQNLDVAVMAASAGVCNPAATCLASGNNGGNADESVSFPATSGTTYYIAVDGVAGSVSSYNLSLSGMTGAGAPACNGPVCSNSFNTLACSLSSQAISGRNDASGATSTVTTWGTTTPCTGATPSTLTTGPEFAYAFTPPVSGSYTFQLLGLKADLDLIIVEADSGGNCDAKAASCVGAGVNFGSASELVTVALSGNKRYFVVVDGKAGAISPYSLVVSDGCP